MYYFFQDRFAKYFVLVSFCLLTFVNGAMWITFAPINKIVMSFYRIQSTDVDWLSTVFLLVYIPFFLPAAMIFENKGLRFGVTLGCILNCLAGWVRYIGGESESFFLLFFGQTIAAIAQPLIYAVPSRLAVVWFPLEQRSTVCSVGVVSNSFGIAIAFLASPLFVQVDADFPFWMLVQAICCSVVLIFMLLFMHPDPEVEKLISEPFDNTRHHSVVQKTSILNTWHNLVRILQIVPFRNLTLAYGFLEGSSFAFATFLPQLFTPVFSFSLVQYGWLGFAQIISGIIFSLICGFLLDANKKYMSANRWLSFTCAVTAVILAIVTIVLFYLSNPTDNIGAYLFLFVANCTLGGCYTAFMVAGFEWAATMGLESNETTTSGVLNTSAQIVGMGLILLGGNCGLSMPVFNAFIALFMLIGAIICYMIKKNDYVTINVDPQ